MSRFSRFSKQPNSLNSATASSSSKIVQRTQQRDYFDEDDEDGDVSNFKPPSKNLGDNDEDDPLDAFMNNINQQVAKEKDNLHTQPTTLPQIVSYGDDEAEVVDDDIDDFEDTEANARYVGSDDEDGEDHEKKLNESMKNPKGKTIEPLPRIDHSQIQYKPFKKSFYSECSELKALTSEEIHQLRKELELSVTSPSAQIPCPSPVKTFKQSGFPSQLLKEIENQGFEKPTAIQAQSIPIALSGNDLLALAKTGSGKTLAYVWPMMIHILAQPQMQLGDGPIALILVPTRELANQIYVEVKKYAKLFQIRFAVVYGGAGKYEMSKALKESPEIVIATPGRFIEMIRMKATNLTRVTYVVLDEADRMFEMGFEYQIRSILLNIQPAKQLLMFSATMKKRIEVFAREMFTNQNEIRVVVGMIGQANADIQQLTHIVPDSTEKWLWLASEIDEFAANGKVLIFVLSKSDTEELAYKLKEFFQKRQLDIQVDCLHGDKDQYERTKIMNRFVKRSSVIGSEVKKDELSILVATDIASRGLDVKDIRTVINYDVAKNIETYVHRIGRTGRMGIEGVTPGTAYTLLTPKDSSFAVDLVQNLRLSAQPVSEELLQLAMKDPKWSRIRHYNQHTGLGGGGGGGGKFFSQSLGKQSGLGSSSSFQGSNRAMTSEMMANSTQQAMQINLPQGLAQVFQAQIDSKNAQTSEGELRRKSRFSSTSSTSTSITTQPNTSFTTLPGFVRASSTSGSSSTTINQPTAPIHSNNPLMKGFVKASTNYASVSTNPPSNNDNHANNQQDQPRKKTRWG